MSAKRKIKSVARLLSYILILLVIVALVGFAAFYTDGFTSSFKTFYVVQGDLTIMERKAVFFPNNEDLRFDVKYTFGFLNKQELKDYDVKVVPDITDKNDFDFTVDDLFYTYSDEKDFTGVFDIKQYEDYFTVNIRDYKYLADVLSAQYSGKVVYAPEIPISLGYLTLIVTSYDGKSSVYIDIIAYLGVESVELAGGGIVL